MQRASQPLRRAGPSTYARAACGRLRGAVVVPCLPLPPPRPTAAPTDSSQRRTWHTGARCLTRAHAVLRPFENKELLAGDVLILTSFAIWKQLSGIVMDPSFPGWLAPLQYSPTRLIEFTGFTLTLCGAWVAAAALTGGYDARATSDVPTALRATSLAWLGSMPVAAAQLVLVTALESGVLVGEEGFAAWLPLAAQGPFEPFVTAAGVLGAMAAWRAYYAVALDRWFGSTPEEVHRFIEALRMVAVMAAVSVVVLEGLYLVLSPELIELLQGV